MSNKRKYSFFDLFGATNPDKKTCTKSFRFQLYRDLQNLSTIAQFYSLNPARFMILTLTNV